jgi:raffinose/stachyose/melibiose transport system permease protein
MRTAETQATDRSIRATSSDRRQTPQEPHRAVPRHSGGRINRKRPLSWAVISGLTVVAIIWMLPLIYMVDVSFRLPQYLFDPALIVWNFTLVNYQTVINGNSLGHYFLNTVIISCASVVLVMGFAAAFAFGVTVLRLPFAKLMYALVLLTLMVPLAALVVPLAQILVRFGWENTYWGLIIPYGALGVPFAVVILRGFMETIPIDLFEAASVEGATTWQLLTRIVLPILKPSLIFIGVWQFITSWNEFFLALIVMTQDVKKTLALVPEQYSGLYQGNPGALFAILVMIAVPLVVLYLVVQRWFVAGLMEGALKG